MKMQKIDTQSVRFLVNECADFLISLHKDDSLTPIEKSVRESIEENINIFGQPNYDNVLVLIKQTLKEKEYVLHTEKEIWTIEFT